MPTYSRSKPAKVIIADRPFAKITVDAKVLSELKKSKSIIKNFIKLIVALNSHQANFMKPLH